MKKCTRCNEEKPFSEYHKHKLTQDGRASRCIKCVREVARKWYFDNKDRKREYDKKRRAEKPHLYRGASKRWRDSNPEKKKADTNSRRRRLRKAMPKWVSPADLKCFYEQAQRVSDCLGVQHHVDHIIPINGKGICGLHVPWNLAVIPAVINLEKGNKF